MIHKAPVERQQKSKSLAVGGQQVVADGLYPCGRSDRCQSHLKARRRKIELVTGREEVAQSATSPQPGISSHETAKSLGIAKTNIDGTRCGDLLSRRQMPHIGLI